MYSDDTRLPFWKGWIARLACSSIILCLIGDTIRLSFTQPSWIELQQTTAPSPRYGFVGGVIGDYWVISHGIFRMMLLHHRCHVVM